MDIQIKNVKFSEFASEETHCFEATVYVDGKREFIASNEGHGGPNNYHALKGGAPNKVWDRVKEIDDELKKEKVDVDGTGQHFISNCLEIVIGDLMNTHLAIKDIKNKLRRKVMAVNAQGEVLSYKADPKRYAPEAFRKLEQRDNVTVLNGLSDDELKEQLKSWLKS